MGSSLLRLGRVSVCLLLVLLLLITFAQLAAASPWDQIKAKIRSIICELIKAFASIATGIGAFTMIIAAIQWISSESDAGARKKAKSTMVHVVVGLIIVSLAQQIASTVIAFSCP
ncbi:MAG: TrbC/VirB2 family protein [Candidatus Altiarchaeota archaeon]